MNDTIDILVIDPNPIIGKGLYHLLMNHFNVRIYCSFELDDIERIFEQKNIRLVFLEVEFYGKIHYSMINYLSNKNKNIEIIFFTNALFYTIEKKYILSQTNNFYYLDKKNSLEELENNLLEILNKINLTYSSNNSNNGRFEYNQDRFQKISNREQEVLLYLIEDKSLRQISQLLNITVQNVYNVKHRIFKKFDINNIHELKKAYIETKSI